MACDDVKPGSYDDRYIVACREEDLMRTADYTKYAELAKWLNLSEQQRQQLLALRQDVLARLERYAPYVTFQ